MNWLKIGFLVCVSALMTACGGGGEAPPPPPQPPPNPPATQSIGGNVAGLTGTVVLQNNGGNNLSVSANGAFTFSTSLASGSAYAVTVLTQPTGQTCAVSNGSGTVANANVTTVAVNCTTNTYTIGGTIAGLTGTVVLQNNGGDNLSRSVNGAFTFATSLSHGTSYAVTVLTQPAGQNCTVSSGAGTATANVGNVAVNCSTLATGWGTPIRIDNTNQPGHSSPPQIGVDQAGNVLVVWERNNNTVWANRFNASTNSWGTETMIEPIGDFVVGGFGGRKPRVAVEPNGNAWAIYRKYDGATNRTNIVVNRYTANNNTWSGSVLIESEPGYPFAPVIAVDANGNALAAWTQAGTVAMDVRGARYSGGAWGPDGLLEHADEATGNGDLGVQIAMNANGDAMLTWVFFEGPFPYLEQNVWRKRYIAGQGWTMEQPLPFDNGFRSGGPQVAMNASADAVIVFLRAELAPASAPGRIRAAGYVGGLFGGSTRLDNESTSAGLPHVALGNNGAAMAVWTQPYGAAEGESDGRRSVFFSRAQTPDVWGSAALVEHSDSVDAFRPRVAMDAQGDALVVWDQSETGNTVFAARYTAATNTFSAPVPIDGSAPAPGQSPQIAIDANGNGMAVWQEFGGGFAESQVYANRFIK